MDRSRPSSLPRRPALQAKGGIVFAIAKELGLPVKYIGVGEGVVDLMPFEPRAFSEALLS